MFKKRYSLKKLKNSYFQAHRWYQNNKETLSKSEKEGLEHQFLAMEKALLNKDKKSAILIWERITPFIEDKSIKKWWDYPLELIGALAFALVVATVIRQMVFEFYEIPSGSMRPTFKERDHLVVSKTTFGINVPLTNKHFYFDPDLVKRGGIFIFSGEGVDLTDTDTHYFWLFPAKKRYIKRCMGKPGDSLYFYGGLLYSVDKEGNDLKELREPPFNTQLDHVPYNNFEGKPSRGNTKPNSLNEIVYKLMNRPSGRLIVQSDGVILGEINNGVRWVKDNPLALKKPHDKIETYSDFLGVKNFALTRLIDRNQLRTLYPKSTLSNKKYPLYLEMAHTPQMAPFGIFEGKLPPNMVTVRLNYFTSFIPLTEEDINLLMSNLYTARFVVEDGRARRFDAPSNHNHEVSLPNVPNGSYEFYDGKAYSIGFVGFTTPLAKDHPLYSKDPKMVQALFNYGIDFSNYFDPTSTYSTPFPTRYAYFREGTLYVMGRPLLDPMNTQLIAYNEQEKARGEKEARYIPFTDYGPPLKEGKIDVEFIRTFGFTIPENTYLALGDNYAMSSDSRTFGPVYQGNIEGTPSLILWPPQERFGSPNAIPYPLFRFPTVLIWGIITLFILAYLSWDKKRKTLPYFTSNT
ncbi:signal peptidase I [Chlamydiales bacterium]|nr:signal peptidase I [Chlamydiales bacterium]